MEFVVAALLLWASFAFYIATGGWEDVKKFLVKVEELYAGMWQVMTLGYNKRKLDKCKVLHQTAYWENEVYGKVVSESVIDHLIVCRKFPEIYKRRLKPPSGSAGCSVATRVVIKNTPVVNGWTIRTICDDHDSNVEYTLSGKAFCLNCGNSVTPTLPETNRTEKR